MNSSSAPYSILERNDGSNIAYHMTSGKSPGVVFLTGFKSDMTGSKAIETETVCKELGHAFLRFDYFGHGSSSGCFENGTIGRWASDAIAVIDELTTGPQILIGSSMGGWIMLLVARARPERVAGLVGIAAAPDFTEDLILDALTTEQRELMDINGYVDLPNCYGSEPYRINKKLIDEGQNNLVLRDNIEVNIPVRLIHGILDEDVPWQIGLTLADKLTSRDVEIIYVKNGDHRLSDEYDLGRLRRVLVALLEDLHGAIF